jgi:hypothetical protein
MSEETTDVFRAMHEATRQQHAKWKEMNMEALRLSPFPYRLSKNSETAMFRIKGKPHVDFYPSTGRWRVVGQGKSRPFSGGAKLFLAWFREATEPER